MKDTCAIVVTYNRIDLLKHCLEALRQQSSPPAVIIVVDNASTDETREVVGRQLQDSPIPLIYERLSENLGGAGGFHRGLQMARARNFSWFWMMDDDALPHRDALSALLERASVATGTLPSIYGSIATPDGQHLCWPLVDLRGVAFNRVEEVPDTVPVAALPFLGILIPRAVVDRIGLPDKDYFLAGDDTEYCFRARAQGISVIAVSSSRISHPSSNYYRFGIGRLSPICFCMPPWKRYYDVRNRIITSKKQGAGAALLKTVPASIIRLAATLINEPARWAQIKAYVAGTIDGLRGITGRRHSRWKLGN